METIYQDIVEVTEVTIGRVNRYLSQGYLLLDKGLTTSPGKLPDSPGVPGTHYVQRRFRYVVGRMRTVEHWEPPTPQPVDGEVPHSRGVRPAPMEVKQDA